MSSATPRKVTTAPSKSAAKAAELLRQASVVPDHIRRVASLLAGNSQRKRSDLRKHQRHQLVSACAATLDVDGSGMLHHVDAYLRNLSIGGVGLLMRETHLIGEVIELRIEVQSVPKYLCGVIVFCRHIEGSVHEVGVQLHQSSHAPQLSAIAKMPKQNTPDWYRAALARLAASRGNAAPIEE